MRLLWLVQKVKIRIISVRRTVVIRILFGRTFERKKADEMFG